MRIVLLTAGLLAAVFASSVADARTWQQSWALAGRPSVKIETNDGHVIVRNGPAGTVSARVTYAVKTWGWHSTPHEPRIDLARDGDAVTILAKTRGRFVVFGGIVEDFRIEVTVPRDCDLSVRSGDGGIDLEPVHGSVHAEAGDGHIRASGLQGNLFLHTGDGGIDAEDLDGALDARTTDGHLRVSGRFDRLELHTADGGMRATVRAGSQLADAWTLTTGDGSMTLLIPKTLQAFLDASCADGRLSVDLPIHLEGSARRHSLVGELNGGRTPLRLRTRDGSMRLGLAP